MIRSSPPPTQPIKLDRSAAATEEMMAVVARWRTSTEHQWQGTDVPGMVNRPDGVDTKIGRRGTLTAATIQPPATSTFPPLPGKNGSGLGLRSRLRGALSPAGTAPQGHCLKPG
ncbi:MAG: hypothetical protein NVSMB25_09960 [Thermoleophilaceae bacterium]